MLFSFVEPWSQYSSIQRGVPCTRTDFVIDTGIIPSGSMLGDNFVGLAYRARLCRSDDHSGSSWICGPRN